MAVIYHAVGFALGFIADRLFGEINSRFHPICLIGKLIVFLEQIIRKVFPKTVRGEKYGGAVLVILVCILVTAMPLLITLAAYKYCPVLLIFTEGLFVYFVTAARSLHDESMKVYYPLKQGDTEAARQAVSMIVGRDTKSLDESGIIRAAVETVAENTSDGVTAPLLWSAVFGGAGGFFYKAVNTMDSMIGYKNDKYINFGKAAARLDDLVNFIPSRICALMMTAAAFATGMDGRSAYKIWRRDRKKHKSPNACLLYTSYFCAKIGMSCDDAFAVSAHGRECSIVSHVRAHKKTFVLLGENPCRRLEEFGFGGLRAFIGERLSYDDEKIYSGTVKELAGLKLDPLSVIMIINDSPEIPRFGIDDDEFIRGRLPMTKSEIRAQVMSRFNINEDDICFDIGAGTGSVSVELSLIHI